MAAEPSLIRHQSSITLPTMRLINIETMKLETFYNEKLPLYGILSHTWGEENDEVTFPDLIAGIHQCRPKAGFAKIAYTCRQAKHDGYGYAWVDTCCIDKSSSAELSEAIQSMFAWYRDAAVCYVYLVDTHISKQDNFLTSRWWTRAWTLQELLAPVKVVFYDSIWKRIGTKEAMVDQIKSATGIQSTVLRDPPAIELSSIAARMSWAANRKATRVEDIAYSLLGIFGINIPLLYGEGERAFKRLQEEIVRCYDDQTVFAWGYEDRAYEDYCAALGSSFDPPDNRSNFSSMVCSILARSPTDFKNSGGLIPIRHKYQPSTASPRGINIEMPIFDMLSWHFKDTGGGSSSWWPPFDVGLLACKRKGLSDSFVGMFISFNDSNSYSRISQSNFPSAFNVSFEVASQADPRSIYMNSDDSRVYYSLSLSGVKHPFYYINLDPTLRSDLTPIGVAPAAWVFNFGSKGDHDENPPCMVMPRQKGPYQDFLAVIFKSQILHDYVVACVEGCRSALEYPSFGSEQASTVACFRVTILRKTLPDGIDPTGNVDEIISTLTNDVINDLTNEGLINRWIVGSISERRVIFDQVVFSLNLTWGKNAPR